MAFLTGKQPNSNREGFPAYVSDRLSAVKWRNWKLHFFQQEHMLDPALPLPVPRLHNLLTDLREERNVIIENSWVLHPAMRIVNDFKASLKQYPPIEPGTPDPYTPPK
ncbi:hypothetical protein D3C81_1797460 [compost metagenome]